MIKDAANLQFCLAGGDWRLWMWMQLGFMSSEGALPDDEVVCGGDVAGH